MTDPEPRVTKRTFQCRLSFNLERSEKRRSSGTLFPANSCAFVFILTLFLSSSVQAESLTYCRDPRDATVQDQDSYSGLKKCDVIEGNLIFAFEIAKSEEEWQKLGPLKIREITGYLIIFNVDFLTSLDLVIPNLRVIRGNTLFYDFALVVNGLSHLQSLKFNLIEVLRGSVSIDNNAAIAAHINKGSYNTTPIRNSSSIQFIDGRESCDPSCQIPESDNVNWINNGRCWSGKSCQNVCVDYKGKGCKTTGVPCPSECVGGCFLTGNKTHCYACKNFRFNDSCSSSCGDLYEFENYRCVSASECTALKFNVLELNGKKKCVADCSPDFLEALQSTSSNFTYGNSFVPEKCPDFCVGGLIDSVAKAQLLRSCTKIKGFLEIRVLQNSFAHELKVLLGKIKEVNGYVHIFESEALQSLDFLANLETINGQELWKGRYALSVHNNEKLEVLWSVNVRNLTLKKGDAMFYANPKLCPQIIEKLLGEETWSRSVPEKDLRAILNGNKMACNIRAEIGLELIPKEQNNTVQVKFTTELLNTDLVNLVGFHVYYQETNEENLEYFGLGQWSLHFEEYTVQNVSGVIAEIVDLKPVTKYGFFVETCSTDTLMEKLRSKITYVTTNPYYPSVPENIRVTSNVSGYIEVTWDPPKYPNGNITEYRLTVSPNFEQRRENIDYCNLSNRNPGVEAQKNESDKDRKNDEETNLSLENVHSVPENCSCPYSTEQESAAKRKREVVDITNKLANFFYFEQVSSKIRKRRSLDMVQLGHIKENCNLSDESMNILLEAIVDAAEKKTNRKQNEPNYGKYSMENVPSNYGKYSMENVPSNYGKYSSENGPFNCTVLLEVLNTKYENNAPPILAKKPPPVANDQIVVRGTSYNITGLTSSSYSVTIQACHSLCSKTAASSVVRVPYSDYEKVVRNVTKKLEGVKAVITWDPPLYNNGNILAYDIIILTKGKIPSEEKVCLNGSQNQITFDEIEEPGSYEVQISAFSDIGALPYITEYYNITNETGIPGYIIITGIFILALIFLFCYCYYVYTRYKSKKTTPRIEEMEAAFNEQYRHSDKSQDAVLPSWKHYLETIIDAQFIHSRSNLSIDDWMGDGKFGFVRKGMLTLASGRVIPVAVKQLKQVADGSVAHQLIDEASLMLKMQSYNLVRTYGVVSTPFELLLVMELMHNGNLSNYLKLNKKNCNLCDSFSEEIVVQFAIQIADGMAYLANKNILHMDLAARNCLLDEHFNVKVSDFGMSRVMDGDYYKLSENKPIPFRWMPPEFFTKKKFTTLSDVWSYGILIWEIVNAGATPYSGCEKSEVVQIVVKGDTPSMLVPNWVPNYLSALMMKCWRFDPNDRPDFSSVVSLLLKHCDNNLEAKFRNKSFHFCGELTEIEDTAALSTTEGADSAIVEEDELEANPNTPLTTPSPSPSVHKTCRDHSRTRTDTPRSIRESLSLAKLRESVSSLRATLSFSRAFPFFTTNTRVTEPEDRRDNVSNNRGPPKNFQYNNQRTLETGLGRSLSEDRLSKQINIVREAEKQKTVPNSPQVQNINRLSINTEIGSHGSNRNRIIVDSTGDRLAATLRSPSRFKLDNHNLSNGNSPALHFR